MVVLACAAVAACTPAGEKPVAQAREASARPTTDAATAPAGRYESFQDELNKRFIAAMERVQQASPQVWEEGGLTALHYLERDFGVMADAQETIARVLQIGNPLPGLVRTDPRGIAESRPVENGMSMEWLRGRMQGLPSRPSDEALIMLATMSAVAHCLPTEADYNARFLRHVDRLDWPADTEWVRLGLYSGFAMHGCITDDVYLKQTEPLLAPLVKWLRSSEPGIDLKAYVLFALTVGDRFSAIPTDVLLAFLRAQRADGSWGGGVLERPADNQAALGAYVIAAMLRAGGYTLPRYDFRLANPAQPASRLSQSARGEDSP